jgi:hypothetical protein
MPFPSFFILVSSSLRATVVLILFLLSQASGAADADGGFCNLDIDKVAVESSKSVDEVPFHRMDLDAFNAIIVEVPARTESWVMDPVRVVLEYLGTSGARSVSIRRCDASGEQASETAVRVLEDGYLDDSVRGTWYNFTLGKDADGRWLIKQGREAYRCWRGHHRESYSENNCS